MHEPPSETDSAPHPPGDDAQDRILAALHHLRTSAAADGLSHWQTNPPRQKAHLEKWAADLGLLLDFSDLPGELVRGGQEHDLVITEKRYFKLTRDGVFGLSPGIELELVPSGQDARRFHLWEATPYQYLERLRLQNLITPDLNRLEGIIVQDDDLAICISQPRFEILPVTLEEIDQWFLSLGFEVITTSAYYRATDNLGIFDAHDKNVVRSSLDPTILIPFDVIPVQPEGGFLDFIEETLASNETLQVIRSTHTTTRATS